MPSYPERAFLPHDVLAEIVRGTLQPRFPDIFSPDNLQPVGIDIAGQKFIDAKGNIVESHDGKIFLQRGSYQVHFGFELPGEFQGVLEPLISPRTSLSRCGVLAGECFTLNDRLDEPASLFGGKIVGIYHVLNPHGVALDVGARLAQLSFITGYAPHLYVTDMLTPARFERFCSSGTIGRDKTTLPTMVDAPSEITNGSKLWKLNGGTPYFVTLKGDVAIANNEVILTSLHQADFVLHPPTLFLAAMNKALGDPGFHGKFSLLVQPAVSLDISEKDGLCRFARIPVIQIGELGQYKGQWKIDAPGVPLVFKSLQEAGLTNVHSQPLEELAERAFGR